MNLADEYINQVYFSGQRKVKRTMFLSGNLTQHSSVIHANIDSTRKLHDYHSLY